MMKLNYRNIQYSLIPSVLALIIIPNFCFSLVPLTSNKSGFYSQIEVGLAQTNKYKGNNNSDLGKYLNDGKSSNTSIIGIELGYEFDNNFRLGLGLNQSQHIFKRNYNEIEEDETVTRNVAKVKLLNRSLMLNSYYDFHAWEKIIPYVTLGIGVAFKNSGDVTLIANNDDPRDQGNDRAKGRNITNLAWAVGGGVKVPINNKWGIILGIKYYDYGKFKTSTSYTDRDDQVWFNESAGTKKLQVHVMTIGINYNF